MKPSASGEDKLSEVDLSEQTRTIGDENFHVQEQILGWKTKGQICCL